MKVLFTCGGTGGHIYPAIAMAEALQELNRKAEVLFVGSINGMEKEIIESRGFKFAGVDARPLIRKFTVKNIVNAFYIVKSLFDAARIVKDFDPDFAAGTGGFVSFPAIEAASFMGKRTLIHEPNIVPGLANRLLGFTASVVTVGFPDTIKYFPKGKTEVTGNPVRESILKKRKSRAAKYFGLSAAKKTVLVMPGSRAAKSINAAMEKLMSSDDKAIKQAQFIWMTGGAGFDAAKKAAKQRKGAKVAVLKFIDDAGLAYSLATAGVLRAGAGTLTELAAVKLPAVLVPYPHATDNHQEKNARVLEARKAALVLNDADLNEATLAEAIKKVLEPKRGAAMRKELGRIYEGNSAIRIIKILTGDKR